MTSNVFRHLLLVGCLVSAACATTSGTDSEGETRSRGSDEATSTSSNAGDGGDGSGTEASKESSGESGYDARLTDYEYPYEVQTRTFRAQGAEREMAYMDVSPESDPKGTVLLLHGKNFSGAYWKRTIETLVDKGYRAVAPDQIGFGKSSKPVDFQYSFHALARHTADLLDDIDAGRVTVVGHSMGGMLATRFALMFPDRTERLALVNPIGLEDWKRKVPYQTVDDWYRRELDKTPEAVRSYMKSSYFDGEWKEAYEPLIEIQAGWIRGPDYDRIARVSALTYDMIFTQPVLYEFEDLKVPTLLLIGDRDRTALGTDLVDDEVAKTMGRYDRLGKKIAARIPDAKLVGFSGIGHLPQFEAFGPYMTELLGFLGEGSDDG